MINIEDFHNCKQIKSFHNYGIYIGPDNNINLNTPLFRYMKLSHLIELLSGNSLYVARRQTFTDKRDSKGSKKELSEFLNSYELVIRLNKKKKKETIEKKKQVWEQFISCWTLNEKEDYLMWKTYGFQEISCRIGTTIGKLIDSITDLSNDVLISKVHYRCYSAPHISTLYSDVFEKTEFYKSEQEVRILVLANNHNSCSQNNVNIPLDIETLDINIIISPFISNGLQNLISETLITQYPLLKSKISNSLLLEY